MGPTAEASRIAGEAAWAEMARRGVPPTPANYAECFARGLPPGSPDGGADEAAEAAMADLLEAAERLGLSVSEGREAAGDYARTLATTGATVRDGMTAPALLRAVETLSAATAAAMERNRLLEERLASTAGRVGHLRRRLADLRTEANADALTGLMNRRGFDAALRRAIGGARAGTSFSLLLLDIDHFKRFNDTYGHAAGDLVLRLVGKLLDANVKGRDATARQGGEEFAVILTGTPLAGARTVAEQIRATMAAQRMTFRRAGPCLGAVTVSIGVAEYRAGEAAATLVERADAALYRAKQSGRDRVHADEAEMAWAG